MATAVSPFRSPPTCSERAADRAELGPREQRPRAPTAGRARGSARCTALVPSPASRRQAATASRAVGGDERRRRPRSAPPDASSRPGRAEAVARADVGGSSTAPPRDRHERRADAAAVDRDHGRAGARPGVDHRARDRRCRPTSRRASARGPPGVVLAERDPGERAVLLHVDLRHVRRRRPARAARPPAGSARGRARAAGGPTAVPTSPQRRAPTPAASTATRGRPVPPPAALLGAMSSGAGRSENAPPRSRAAQHVGAAGAGRAPHREGRAVDAHLRVEPAGRRAVDRPRAAARAPTAAAARRPAAREGAEHARPADPEHGEAAAVGDAHGDLVGALGDRRRRRARAAARPRPTGGRGRRAARRRPAGATPARRCRRATTSRSSTLHDVGARPVHGVGGEPARLRRGGRQRGQGEGDQEGGEETARWGDGIMGNRCRAGKLRPRPDGLTAGGRRSPPAAPARARACRPAPAPGGSGRARARRPAIPQAARPSGGPQDAGRAPVAAEPAAVGGEQHDVDGAGAGGEVLARGHGVLVLHHGGRDQRRRAVELGRRLRARRLLEPGRAPPGRGRGSATGS